MDVVNHSFAESDNMQGKQPRHVFLGHKPVQAMVSALYYIENQYESC